MTSMIRCMIVDDEPLARSVLERLLARIDDVTVVGSCASAIDAREALAASPVDLLFLDIQMPELTGLDLVPLLSSRPAVVFTTAHREFAVEGFELEALDYLLKPISMARLMKAVDRFRESREAPQAAERTHITVRADRQNVHIRLADILYIESMRDYVRIFTASDTIVTKRALSDLEEELSEIGFVRIHHSFLVRRDAVEAHAAEFVLVAGKRLPVGRAYRESALARLA